MKKEKTSSLCHSNRFDKYVTHLDTPVKVVTTVGNLKENMALKSKSKLLVDILNSARKMCKEKIEDKFDIVWYALNRCRLHNHPASKRIEGAPEYQKAIEELQENDCNFHHGFNSGVLATARMYQEHISFEFKDSIIWNKEKLLAHISKKIKQSKDTFPNLNIEEFPVSAQEFLIPELKVSRQENPASLKIWNKIIIDSLKKLEETAEEKEKQAYDLVWFAQYRCRYPKHKDSKRIEFDTPGYKEKITQLRGNEGDFYHGFNSGILAFSRLLLMIVSVPKVSSTKISSFENVASEYARKAQKAKLSFPDLSVHEFPSDRKD